MILRRFQGGRIFFRTPTNPCAGYRFAVGIHYASADGHRAIHPQNVIGGDDITVRRTPQQSGIGEIVLARRQFQFGNVGWVNPVADAKTVRCKSFPLELATHPAPVFNRNHWDGLAAVSSDNLQTKN